MAFKLEFETGNAAFQDGNAGAEVSQIMYSVVERVLNGYTHGAVMDSNGNTVGQFELTEDN